MNRNSSRTIALIGVMAALIFGLLALETVVLAPVLPVSPCYLSLPLAVSLSLYRKDVKGMFIGGTVFGFCSFILSFILGIPAFMNPLISVIPRVALGVTAGFTYVGLSKLFKNAKSDFIKKTVPASIGGLVGAITNTVLVVVMLFAFGQSDIKAALTAIISFNALIELGCCLIICPMLVSAARKFYKLDDVTVEDEIDDQNTDSGDKE